MPLNKNTLQQKILLEFTTPSPNKTMKNHADALADAYDTYCKGAITAYGGSLSVTGKQSFSSTYMSTIEIPVPTLINYGLAIELACISYWTNSSFPLITGVPPLFASQSNITITPPTPGSMSTKITLDLSTGVSDSKAAEILTENMDIGTKTVTTTHTGILSSTGLPSTVGPSPIS